MTIRYQDPYQVHLPLLQLLARNFDDLSSVEHVVPSRWSKSDRAGAADQLRRTASSHSHVPAVAAITAQPATSVPVRVGDVIQPHARDDISASTQIGVVWMHGPVLVLQLGFSGSVAGTVTNERGDKTLVVVEAVIQLLKAIRHVQGDELPPLDLRTSPDWTRTSRVPSEAERLYEWTADLRVGWWTGRDQVSGHHIVRAVYGSEAKADNVKTVGRTSEGIVDHLPYPDRAPVSESQLPVWRRHVRDGNALDGRRRVGGGKGRSALLAEWDIDVVPAVQATLRAVAAGATHAELAAIGVAHRIPIPATTNGPRTKTMADVPWSSAEQRMTRLLWVGDGTRLPDNDLDRRRKLSRIIAARDGVDVIRFTLPKQAPVGLETYGTQQLPVHRHRPTDRGFVQVDRQIGWPPKHEVIDSSATITVPLGTFTGPSRVLGLVETPISETEATVEVPIGVLGDPVVDEDGSPVPWERLGVDTSVYEAIIDRYSQPSRNDGGRRHTSSTTAVVPPVPDVPVTINGQDRTLRLRPIGPHRSRVRQVWARPVDIVGGWRLEQVRRVDGRLLIDTTDVTDWRVGSIQERALLRSVADAVETAATTALATAGDIDLAVPAASHVDPVAQAEADRARLAARADSLREEADRLEEDADGQDLLAGRALQRQEEDKVIRYEDRAEELRGEAARLRDQADRVVADAEHAVTAAAAGADTTGEIDISRLSHLLAAMQVVASRDHDTPGLVTGDATVIATILHRMLDEDTSDWTVDVDLDVGELRWTATATIATRDSGQLRMPLHGRVPLTGYRQEAPGSGIPSLVSRWMTGELPTIEDLQAAGPRETSRAAVVKTWIRPTLGELYGVAPQRRMALTDHPYGIIRHAVHAAVTGDRPSPAPWTAAWEDHIVATYRDTTGWNDAACPMPTVDAAIIIGCLAQVETATVTELVNVTGIDAGTIRALARPRHPYHGGPGRPALIHRVSSTTVALHRCPHEGCDGVADVLAYLPETHVASREPGGVLCRTCRRVPHPDLANVRFPAVYAQRPVTRDPGLDIRHGSVTHAPTTIPLPTAVHIPMVDVGAGSGPAAGSGASHRRGQR